MIEVIPAIDLKDHQVVRLSQGRMDDEIVYAKDPVEMANKWISQGAGRIHLVDLNGAFEGKPVHYKEVEQISKKYPTVEIEIGGGIRNEETIRTYFDAGVKYCIIGTAAIKNPEFLIEMADKYPNQIILGLDAKNGMVATEGWDEVSTSKATDVVNRFQGLKINSIIYTDIAKDGMLQGMNYKEIELMAHSSPFPIIGSGGLTSLDDISALKKINNVCGVIAGKALYENRFSLEEAIATARGETSFLNL